MTGRNIRLSQFLCGMTSAFLAATTIPSPSAVAAPISWASDSNGLWSTPTNWVGGVVPGPTDDVIIDRGSANPIVTLTVPSEQVTPIRSLESREALVVGPFQYLTVSAPSRIEAPLTVDSGIGGSGLLTVTGATLWNGSLGGLGFRNSSTPGGSRVDFFGPVTLSQFIPAPIARNVNRDTTVNLLGNTTWSDTGPANVTGFLNISNGSVINNRSGATFEVKHDFIVDGVLGFGETVANFAINNEGTFRKSGGNTIRSGFRFVSFNNSGLFQLQSGGVEFGGGGTSGGVFEAAPGTTLDFLAGHTFLASSRVDAPGAQVRLHGTTTISGDFSASSTALVFPLNNVRVDSSDKSVSFGALTLTQGSLVVATTIQSAKATSFAAGSVTLIQPGSVMEVSPGLTGLFGSLVLDGRLVSNVNVSSSGVLSGSGILQGNVNTLGRVSPGSSVGTLRIEGDYTQSELPEQRLLGRLVVEIDGGGPLANDLLQISGSAFLDGILDLKLLDGFEPDLGEIFVFLTAGSVTGTFDEIFGAFIDTTKRFEVVYETGSVALRVVAVAVPEPPVLAQLILGVALLGWVRVSTTVSGFHTRRLRPAA